MGFLDINKYFYAKHSLDLLSVVLTRPGAYAFAVIPYCRSSTATEQYKLLVMDYNSYDTCLLFE